MQSIFLAALLMGTSPQRPPPMSPPVPPFPPANCAEPEYRQLDFLIGDWDVFDNDAPNSMVGGFTAGAVAFGCGFRELWNPFTLIEGESLISYDKRRRIWRRTWIDALGQRAEFDGVMKNGRMIFTGRWPSKEGAEKDALLRETFWKEDKIVRHLGEESRDNGISWIKSFDFTYWPDPDRRFE